MAWINTGMERCKTLRIDKQVGGVSLSGYPKDYSILAAFSQNGNSYGVITETEFMQLSEADYTNRLADFKDYVEAAESVANVDSITESGYEAYRENTTSCPVGE
jgi:hypothetical protein